MVVWCLPGFSVSLMLSMHGWLPFGVSRSGGCQHCMLKARYADVEGGNGGAGGIRRFIHPP